MDCAKSARGFEPARWFWGAAAVKAVVAATVIQTSFQSIVEISGTGLYRSSKYRFDGDA
jgi:hypothetical protein